LHEIVFLQKIISLILKQEPVPILSFSEKDKKIFEETFEFASIFKPYHSQFHINKLEDVVSHLKFPIPPHRQTVADFIFLTKGKSVRGKGLDKYEFGPNTFFFLPAYQISTHDSMTRDAEGYYSHFDLDLFSRKSINPDFIAGLSFLQFNGNPLATIDDNTRTHIISLLNRIETEYNKEEKSNIDILAANLLAILTEVNQFYKAEMITENAAFRITQQYKSKLALYIYEKHTVAEYAGMLNISPNHLNKCVKAATGKSAQELLSEMVLLEAKVLLKQTSLAVNEIAWKTGKEDPSDFIRFFKSRTGLTPTEYRKKD
jgi:AraC family transcriptional regulator, transcriptional activator of pobA